MRPGGVDGLALLGDLSWFGDATSLETRLRLAVWAVSGNHDLGEREDALARTVRRVGAKNVRLATSAGEVFDSKDIRVAGLCVASVNDGYTARSDERPDDSGWRGKPVVLLSHYRYDLFSGEGREEESLLRGQRTRKPRRGRPAVVEPGGADRGDQRAQAHARRLRGGAGLQISCAALTQPPFDVTLLDLETGGGRISVGVERISIAPSTDDVRLSALSPTRLRWVFEEGT
jgi:hypothetical protein